MKVPAIHQIRTVAACLAGAVMLAALPVGCVALYRARFRRECGHRIAMEVNADGRYVAEALVLGHCRQVAKYDDDTIVEVLDRSKVVGGVTRVLNMVRCRQVRLKWRDARTLEVHYELPGSTPERISKIDVAGDVSVAFVPFNSFDGCPLKEAPKE